MKVPGWLFFSGIPKYCPSTKSTKRCNGSIFKSFKAFFPIYAHSLYHARSKENQK
jgi:hypothetical protein